MHEHAEAISENTASYVEQLKALDVEAKASLAELAPDKRTVVTAHDAFGYLADAYGMNFLAPVGIDSEAEPSANVKNNNPPKSVKLLPSGLCELLI